MREKISLSQQIAEESGGLRLDQAAVELFPDFSRGRLQQWIKKGELTINGKRGKPSARVNGGEKLCIEAELVAEGEVEPQDIPLDIIYEDEHLIVVNKPVGLVVHPCCRQLGRDIAKRIAKLRSTTGYIASLRYRSPPG